MPLIVLPGGIVVIMWVLAKAVETEELNIFTVCFAINTHRGTAICAEITFVNVEFNATDVEHFFVHQFFLQFTKCVNILYIIVTEMSMKTLLRSRVTIFGFLPKIFFKVFTI